MTHQPQSVADLQDVVRSHHAIVIRGAGTKSPPLTDDRVTVDLTQMTGVTEYSPDECVFTALAGTPLRDIDEQLRRHHQYLPFDPPLMDAGATIGGTVAMGLSGSGRYRYGGVRDFLIGTRVVDGNGTVIRSGGKVVKNAAGFLLHHGMVGSAGRFGILVEVTFKVFPSPEARATVRVSCRSTADARALAQTIERRRFDLEAMDFNAAGTLWIRVAGRAEALEARVAQLRSAVGDSEALQGADEERAWGDAREFAWAAGRAIVKAARGAVSSSMPTENARYFCAGSAMWIATADPATLAGVHGLVIRGVRAGTRVGPVTHNEFEERVRRVLDPQNRFRAASDPDR